jgi:hypothetical protein
MLVISTFFVFFHEAKLKYKDPVAIATRTSSREISGSRLPISKKKRDGVCVWKAVRMKKGLKGQRRNDVPCCAAVCSQQMHANGGLN